MKKTPKELFKHIRQIEIRTTQAVQDLLAGVYHSAFKGRGIEFDEVREYKENDEIRDIDWNVTARMNHPYIKKFHEERELTVMLVVDVSASNQFGSFHKTKQETIAELGALLAFSAIRNQDKVGLILFSDVIELYLSPKKGTRHVLRLIRELIAFEPKSRGTNLQNALSFLGQIQRQHALCFLISDFQVPSLPDSIPAARILSKRHEWIAIQVQDLHEKTLPALGFVHFKDLETSETLIESLSLQQNLDAFSQLTEEKQKFLKLSFAKLGIDFLSISCDDSFSTTLHHFFKWRGRH